MTRSRHTQIMGVMNITPDSFFDGGRLDTVDAAVAHARRLLDDGADWLDIGGESSRPGADPVPAEEEVTRVLPVLEALQPLGAQVSLDTYHAGTARRGLAAGVRMINDITALRGDHAMADAVAEAGCFVALMHMRGSPKTMQDAPEYDDVVDDICAFFEERLRFAEAAGIQRDRIWLDPGFGFGKTVPHNLEILRRLDAFTQFGCPVLIGTSNKSTISAVLDGAPPDQRTEGTAATVAVSILHGAHCVRVHDVKAMARVARMTDAIAQGSEYNG